MDDKLVKFPHVSSISTAALQILNSTTEAPADRRIRFICCFDVVFLFSAPTSTVSVSFKIFQSLSSSPLSEMLVLAVTDWPAPSAFPWLPVSGLLVLVWVSSCRLFVDCAGRRRGGGVGVDVRRTADSCSKPGLSLLLSSSLRCYCSSSALFTSPPALNALPSWSKSALDDNAHTLLLRPGLLFLFFVLTPIAPLHCLQLSLPPRLFISLQQLLYPLLLLLFLPLLMSFLISSASDSPSCRQ